MKDYEVNDISQEEAYQQILKQRNEILGEFAKAYIAESELKPSEIELVHKSEEKDGEIIETFYFRERKVEN